LKEFSSEEILDLLSTKHYNLDEIFEFPPSPTFMLENLYKDIIEKS